MFHTKKYTFFSGLTTILRSEAGGQSDRFGHDDDDDDLQRNYHNNAHWLHPPELAQPSNFVAYYDATSLYPSSGELTKCFFFFFFFRNARIAVRHWVSLRDRSGQSAFAQERK